MLGERRTLVIMPPGENTKDLNTLTEAARKVSAE